MSYQIWRVEDDRNKFQMIKLHWIGISLTKKKEREAESAVRDQTARMCGPILVYSHRKINCNLPMGMINIEKCDSMIRA